MCNLQETDEILGIEDDIEAEVKILKQKQQETIDLLTDLLS